MWHMQSGDRVFTKAEWACLAAPVDLLRDWIENDIAEGQDDPSTGIAVFDGLTSEQKLLILTETCEALVREDVPMPHHTAVNEGTIAAIFSMLTTMIEMECEAGGTTLRKALLAAMEGEDELPPAKSKDIGEWEFVIDGFSDRVLWDSDYAMGDTFADLPPGQNDEMGVGGKSAAIVREPAAAELAGLSARLGRLVRGDNEA